MNRVTAIATQPIVVRNTWVSVAPTKMDFSTPVKTSASGTTKLYFQAYPWAGSWNVVGFNLNFKNNSLGFIYYAFIPWVIGQFDYVYDYGGIVTYTYKITITGIFQNPMTGEVRQFESAYYKQP